MVGQVVISIWCLTAYDQVNSSTNMSTGYEYEHRSGVVAGLGTWMLRL